MTKPERDQLAVTASLDDALSNPAFPWQNALLNAFMAGDVPSALDLPTGLGKTSVMAIWLVAKIRGAKVPRRLVYVVDRRAVVDQATTEALRLRDWVQSNSNIADKLGLEKGALPISTLRGQFVDNREWLEDPSNPAIIIGTVDMIGSRLLFEGYGSSRKIRPYQAALLACDSLFVLDEAHLIPPFQALLNSISQNASLYAAHPSIALDQPAPMQVLSLSATQRSHSHNSHKTFSLTPSDIEHPIVKQRVQASKALRILPAVANGKLADELVSAAWSIYQEKNAPLSCIVFCNSREDASKVAKGLSEKSKKEKIDASVELFVGERRIREREAAAKKLEELGFIAGSKKKSTNPRFLVATSAAEVGVDLDADHLVCDVVPYERMVQRLGRVNRRGEGSALVRVVATPSDFLKKELEKKEDEQSGDAKRYHLTLALLQKLPASSENELNASPSALRTLAQSENELTQQSSTPAPLHPALDRATLEAWAMTSLPEHPGRPFVAPWLRGWVEDEPQVTLVWRKYIGAPEEIWSNEQRAAFAEAVPVHASESLDVDAERALGWLKDRVKAIAEAVKKNDSFEISLDTTLALVLNGAGEFLKALTLKDLITDEKLGEWAQLDRKKLRDNLNHLERDYLPNGTMLLDKRLGGLHESGLLDENNESAPITSDGDTPWFLVDSDAERTNQSEVQDGSWRGSRGAEPRVGLGETQQEPLVRWRISTQAETAEKEKDPDPNWRKRLRLPWEVSSEGETSEWLTIEKWRHDAATEEDRSAGNPQLLSDHQAWTEERAALLGKRLQLSDQGVALLRIAARLHDEGKRAKIWQQAMKAPNEPKGSIWAKTKGPVAPKLLNGYRHELGSLGYVTKDAEFLHLHADDQDLVLHMVAAHHGYARPLIGTNGLEDRPPSAAQALAQEVALRYFRLSERWGPWGLAYWESLLRAADQQASRANDQPKKGAGQ